MKKYLQLFFNITIHRHGQNFRGGTAQNFLGGGQGGDENFFSAPRPKNFRGGTGGGWSKNFKSLY